MNAFQNIFFANFYIFVAANRISTTCHIVQPAIVQVTAVDKPFKQFVDIIHGQAVLKIF